MTPWLGGRHCLSLMRPPQLKRGPSTGTPRHKLSQHPACEVCDTWRDRTPSAAKPAPTSALPPSFSTSTSSSPFHITHSILLQSSDSPVFSEEKRENPWSAPQAPGTVCAVVAGMRQALSEHSSVSADAVRTQVPPGCAVTASPSRGAKGGIAVSEGTRFCVSGLSLVQVAL